MRIAEEKQQRGPFPVNAKVRAIKADRAVLTGKKEFDTIKKNAEKNREGKMGWFVYMLRCGDGSLYTGYTDDVQRRLAVHQSGKGAKYTRSHPPVELAYWEELPDRSSALRREAAIKKLTRKQKLTLIVSATEKQNGNDAE